MKEETQIKERCVPHDLEGFIGRWLNPEFSGDGKAIGYWFYQMLSETKGLNKQKLSATINALPYADFLKTPYWRAVARKVKFRAGFRCQLCNARNLLNVHHRTYEIHGNEHHKLRDMCCLCNDCHARFHNIAALDTKIGGEH